MQEALVTATIIPLNLSRFTAADERLMSRIEAHLERLGFAMTRETGEAYDSFLLYSAYSCWTPREGTMVPAWVLVRDRHGRYQIQDGFGSVLYRGLRQIGRASCRERVCQYV